MLPLLAHPATPSPVGAVAAGVERAAERVLAVRYRIEGGLEGVRIPPRAQPRPGNELWRHTCCEIFVAAGGHAAYREYNLSPSGEWAGYRFVRYREGGPAAVGDPGIAVRRGDDFVELEARIPAEPGGLRLGLSAVIEAEDGALSYWALKHPSPRPDFHHPDAFAVELE